MIKLYELKPRIPKKKRRRVGRGGKRGTFSGRGMKGQKSRAGIRISPHVKLPLLKRLPKKRGFVSLKIRPAVLNVGDLQKRFKTGEKITIKKLYEVGLLKRPKLRIKILGNGELSKKFTIEAHAFSSQAKEKIEKAGGKVVEIKKIERVKEVKKVEEVEKVKKVPKEEEKKPVKKLVKKSAKKTKVLKKKSSS